MMACPVSPSRRRRKGRHLDYIKGMHRLTRLEFGLQQRLILIVYRILFRLAEAMDEERRINVCKTGIHRIIEMLRSSPQQWRSYLALARSIMAHIDATTLMQQPSRAAEQSWMIATLQRLASVDTDRREVSDITAWCTRQWTIIYQRDPQNIAALRGIGQVWLSRAEPSLTRIHRLDGSSSSSGGSSQMSARSITSGDDERLSAAAIAEAERRAGTADYVEARGFLQPAVEYSDRAVAAAQAQHCLSGELLAMVRTLQ